MRGVNHHYHSFSDFFASVDQSIRILELVDHGFDLPQTVVYDERVDQERYDDDDGRDDVNHLSTSEVFGEDS